MFIVGHMSKKSKRNKNKGRGRRQVRNGKNSISSYENSILRREIQSVGVLKIPMNSNVGYGYSIWGSVIGAAQEFKELSDLYAQCRLTKVIMRFSPQSFHSTLGPTYVPLVGCVAHDPTNQVLNSTPASYADMAMLPRSKLYASSGQGDLTWKSLAYAAPLNKSGDYSNSSDSVPAGTWGATNQFGATCAGITGFSAQTQNGNTNTTMDEEVLQIIMTFLVEFKMPCADRGQASMKSSKLVLCVPSESPVMVGREVEEKKNGTIRSLSLSVKPSPSVSSKSSSSFRNWAP